MSEAEGLLETFSALLRIAQVEGASPRAGFRDTDLSTIVEAVANAYRPNAEDAEHGLMTDLSENVVVHGDGELLTQAVATIVENALRHTPAGTMIRISLSANDDSAPCLTVEDAGPWVSDRDLVCLTDRFYRGERSHTTPGNGLGLSVVAAVAELHNARLKLQMPSKVCAYASFSAMKSWSDAPRATCQHRIPCSAGVFPHRRGRAARARGKGSDVRSHCRNAGTEHYLPPERQEPAANRHLAGKHFAGPSALSCRHRGRNGFGAAEAAAFGATWLEALVLAILVGTAVRTAWSPGQRWFEGTNFSAKTLLQIVVFCSAPPSAPG